MTPTNAQLSSVLQAASTNSQTRIVLDKFVLGEFTEYEFSVSFENFIGTVGVYEFVINSGTSSGIEISQNDVGSLTFKMYFDYQLAFRLRYI